MVQTAFLIFNGLRARLVTPAGGKTGGCNPIVNTGPRAAPCLPPPSGAATKAEVTGP
jgi:hypothetical protein